MLVGVGVTLIYLSLIRRRFPICRASQSSPIQSTSRASYWRTKRWFRMIHSGSFSCIRTTMFRWDFCIIIKEWKTLLLPFHRKSFYRANSEHSRVGSHRCPLKSSRNTRMEVRTKMGRRMERKKNHSLEVCWRAKPWKRTRLRITWCSISTAYMAEHVVICRGKANVASVRQWAEPNWSKPIGFFFIVLVSELFSLKPTIPVPV